MKPSDRVKLKVKISGIDINTQLNQETQSEVNENEVLLDIFPKKEISFNLESLESEFLSETPYKVCESFSHDFYGNFSGITKNVKVKHFNSLSINEAFNFHGYKVLINDGKYYLDYEEKKLDEENIDYLKQFKDKLEKANIEISVEGKIKHVKNMDTFIKRVEFILGRSEDIYESLLEIFQIDDKDIEKYVENWSRLVAFRNINKISKFYAPDYIEDFSCPDFTDCEIDNKRQQELFYIYSNSTEGLHPKEIQKRQKIKKTLETKENIVQMLFEKKLYDKNFSSEIERKNFLKLKAFGELNSSHKAFLRHFKNENLNYDYSELKKIYKALNIITLTEDQISLGIKHKCLLALPFVKDFIQYYEHSYFDSESFKNLLDILNYHFEEFSENYERVYRKIQDNFIQILSQNEIERRQSLLFLSNIKGPELLDDISKTVYQEFFSFKEFMKPLRAEYELKKIKFFVKLLVSARNKGQKYIVFNDKFYYFYDNGYLCMDERKEIYLTDEEELTQLNKSLKQLADDISNTVTNNAKLDEIFNIIKTRTNIKDKLRKIDMIELTEYEIKLLQKTKSSEFLANLAKKNNLRNIIRKHLFKENTKEYIKSKIFGVESKLQLLANYQEIWKDSDQKIWKVSITQNSKDVEKILKKKRTLYSTKELLTFINKGQIILEDIELSNIYENLIQFSIQGTSQPFSIEDYNLLKEVKEVKDFLPQHAVETKDLTIKIDQMPRSLSFLFKFLNGKYINNFIENVFPAEFFLEKSIYGEGPLSGKFFKKENLEEYISKKFSNIEKAALIDFGVSEFIKKALIENKSLIADIIIIIKDQINCSKLYEFIDKNIKDDNKLELYKLRPLNKNALLKFLKEKNFYNVGIVINYLNEISYDNLDEIEYKKREFCNDLIDSLKQEISQFLDDSKAMKKFINKEVIIQSLEDQKSKELKDIDLKLHYGVLYIQHSQPEIKYKIGYIKKNLDPETFVTLVEVFKSDDEQLKESLKRILKNLEINSNNLNSIIKPLLIKDSRINEISEILKDERINKIYNNSEDKDKMIQVLVDHKEQIALSLQNKSDVFINYFLAFEGNDAELKKLEKIKNDHGMQLYFLLGKNTGNPNFRWFFNKIVNKESITIEEIRENTERKLSGKEFNELKELETRLACFDVKKGTLDFYKNLDLCLKLGLMKLPEESSKSPDLKFQEGNVTVAFNKKNFKSLKTTSAKKKLLEKATSIKDTLDILSDAKEYINRLSFKDIKDEKSIKEQLLKSFNSINELKEKYSSEKLTNLVALFIKEEKTETKIAILREILWRTNGIFLNHAQIIALLNSRNNDNAEAFVQLPTGSGKSIILAADSALDFYEGKTTYLATTNNYLANEAYNDFLLFYKTIGVDVILVEDDMPELNIKKKLLIGSMENLIFFNQELTLSGNEQYNDVIKVDEADLYLQDSLQNYQQCKNINYLFSEDSRREFLSTISEFFEYIYDASDNTINIKSAKLFLEKNRHKFSNRDYVDYLEKLNEENWQFIVASKLEADRLVEGVHYLIKDKKIIPIIEHEPQYSSTFKHFTQHFLCLKNNLEIPQFTESNISYTAVSFMKKFKKRFYLSGTVAHDREWMNITCPVYKQPAIKDSVRDDYILQNFSSETIIQNIKEIHEKGLTALVYKESAVAVIEMQSTLKSELNADDGYKITTISAKGITNHLNEDILPYNPYNIKTEVESTKKEYYFSFSEVAQKTELTNVLESHDKDISCRTKEAFKKAFEKAFEDPESKYDELEDLDLINKNCKGVHISEEEYKIFSENPELKQNLHLVKKVIVLTAAQARGCDFKNVGVLVGYNEYGRTVEQMIGRTGRQGTYGMSFAPKPLKSDTRILSSKNAHDKKGNEVFYKTSHLVEGHGKNKQKIREKEKKIINLKRDLVNKESKIRAKEEKLKNYNEKHKAHKSKVDLVSNISDIYLRILELCEENFRRGSINENFKYLREKFSSLDIKIEINDIKITETYNTKIPVINNIFEEMLKLQKTTDEEGQFLLEQEQENSKLEEEKKALAQEISELNKEIQHLEQEIEELKKENTGLKTKTGQIQNSLEFEDYDTSTKTSLKWKVGVPCTFFILLVVSAIFPEISSQFEVKQSVVDFFEEYQILFSILAALTALTAVSIIILYFKGPRKDPDLTTHNSPKPCITSAKSFSTEKKQVNVGRPSQTAEVDSSPENKK